MSQGIRLRFAKRLRALRWQCGWTQEELAERADLAYRHVQRLESLKNPPPAKIDTLEKLAHAFKVSPEKLLAFEQLAGYLTGDPHTASLAAEPRGRFKAGKRLRPPLRRRRA
jgi:transcriptional regulator with XRE-family HTH domain